MFRVICSLIVHSDNLPNKYRAITSLIKTFLKLRALLIKMAADPHGETYKMAIFFLFWMVSEDWFYADISEKLIPSLGYQKSPFKSGHFLMF